LHLGNLKVILCITSGMCADEETVG
jgi:hypothetical protein